LHNSQPTGLQTLSSTEGGAYTLTGITGLITRNSSATVWIPTEDEWYKAAYHDPTAGGTGNYWLYPTRSDSIPALAAANATGDVSNPGTNVANYFEGADWNGLDGNVTTVGSTTSEGHYGTLDQGGNLWEWNEAIIGASRGQRGGSFFNPENLLRSSRRQSLGPSLEAFSVGFRVASIPEPGVTVLAVLAGLLLPRRRRG
jgi:formylglycine-generating enzyme required for sulfatase activity